MKFALEDKNSRRYHGFIKQLKMVFARDERLYNFVCESVPSDALEAMETQISVVDVIDESFTEVYGPGS